MPDGLEWWIKTDADGNIVKKLKINIPKELFVPEEYDRTLGREDIAVLRQNPSRDSYWDGAKIKTKTELVFQTTKDNILSDGVDWAEVSMPGLRRNVQCYVAKEERVLRPHDAFYISSDKAGVIVVKLNERHLKAAPLLIRAQKTIPEGGPE
jgi:hypothetical protein